MKEKILIPAVVSEVGVEELINLGYDVDYSPGITREELLEKISNFDSLIVRGEKIDRELLERGKNLKVLAKHGAGFDNFDLDAAKELGITVFRTPSANSSSVAEYAVALMIELSKKTSKFIDEYRKGDYWVKDRIFRFDLRERCLGLLGAGNIGSIVAEIYGCGFGMKVNIYDSFIKEENKLNHKNITYTADRNSVIENADFLSLHLPSNDDTKKSIGIETFKMMKNSAYLINVSRGDLVVEKELIDAIKTGEIAGAGLDVSNPEPANPDNELFKLDNVVLTPHCAAGSVDAMDRMILGCVEGIHDFFNGKEPKFKLV